MSCCSSLYRLPRPFPFFPSACPSPTLSPIPRIVEVSRMCCRGRSYQLLTAPALFAFCCSAFRQQPWSSSAAKPLLYRRASWSCRVVQPSPLLHLLTHLLVLGQALLGLRQLVAGGNLLVDVVFVGCHCDVVELVADLGTSWKKQRKLFKKREANGRFNRIIKSGGQLRCYDGEVAPLHPWLAVYSVCPPLFYFHLQKEGHYPVIAGYCRALAVARLSSLLSVIQLLVPLFHCSRLPLASACLMHGGVWGNQPLTEH